MGRFINWKRYKNNRKIKKSYIINFHYVNAIEGNTLEIEHHKIPVGRSYREKALQKIYNTGDKGWRS